MTPINYTLALTSPPTRGARVLAAQRVLNGGNILGRDFLLGPDSEVDGVFGEATARACKRAKYWLGYPTAEITPTYGPHLDSFLHGVEQPTPEMVRRQELRRKEAAQTPLRVKALTEAKRHIGVKEFPAGSNNVLFSRWYGITGPWCAMFVTWCYEQFQSQAFVKGSRYAYVPYVVNDARAGRNWLQVVAQPQPGDLVCYDWDGGVADHIGLFEQWKTGDEFDAVEGNTAVGNDSNGGQVMRRRRRRALVECFVRVGR